MEPERRSPVGAAAAGSAATGPQRAGGKIRPARPRVRSRTKLRVVRSAEDSPALMTQETTSRSGPVSRLLDLEQRRAGLDFSDIRARLVRGEADGWRIFVERYSRTLYTMALSLAAAPDREEIAQEAYMAILERFARDNCRVLRNFREEARFETYLFTAARNAVALLHRRGARDRARLADPIEPAVDRLKPSLAETIGLAPDRVAELLAESLSALEPRERLILRLRFRQGLPYRRLAQMFDWKDTNAAAYEICKILRKLRLLERCRSRLRWGEPEREILLRGLRGWLEGGLAGGPATDPERLT